MEPSENFALNSTDESEKDKEITQLKARLEFVTEAYQERAKIIASLQAAEINTRAEAAKREADAVDRLRTQLQQKKAEILSMQASSAKLMQELTQVRLKFDRTTREVAVLVGKLERNDRTWYAKAIEIFHTACARKRRKQ